MRYLGIPIHYRRLSNADWKRVEERFEKKTQQLERKTSVNWWALHTD
jgi:predicted component of type VI protein secretion system